MIGHGRPAARPASLGVPRPDRSGVDADDGGELGLGDQRHSINIEKRLRSSPET